MTTLYTRTLFPPPSTSLPNPAQSTPPGSIPPLVYRVHHPSSRTSYSFTTGFKAKNHTTILSTTSTLNRFGLAHIHFATNISSPFISVYDSKEVAERVAGWMSNRYSGEEVLVVEVDTRYLARGPVLRAADLLREEQKMGQEVVGTGRRDSAVSRGSAASGGSVGGVVRGREGEKDAWLHEGEYLIMYRIPMQAVRGQTVVARGGVRSSGGGVGVIGSR